MLVTLDLEFRKLSLLLIWAFVSGCSSSWLPAWRPHDSSLKKSETSTSKPSRQNPIELAVLREVNDGKLLHVLAEVRSHTEWPTSELVLEVRSYQEGSEHSVERYALDSFINGDRRLLEPESPLPVTFSLDAAATDYQVSVLWGKEARRYLVGEKPQRLILEDLEIEEDSRCQGQNCRPSFVITGTLRNNSSALITGATLGIGLASSNTLGRPSAEEKVSVPGLNLEPKEAQPIRLVYQASANSAPGMEPRVRVVSIE